MLKACSGKFMPIRQWFYFDATEALPSNLLTDDESNYICEVGRASSQMVLSHAPTSLTRQYESHRRALAMRARLQCLERRSTRSC